MTPMVKRTLKLTLKPMEKPTLQRVRNSSTTQSLPSVNAWRTKRMTGTALISTFDALLSDLDGVVYAGAHAIPGAVESLRRLAGVGVGLGYVTNNASRSPAQVAQHLRDLGAPAEDHQVVSSSQAAAALLASLLPAGHTC